MWAMLGLVACGAPPPEEPKEGILEVTPAEIAFGEVEVGVEAREDVELANAGIGDLAILNIYFVESSFPENDAVFRVDTRPGDIPIVSPGSSYPLAVFHVGTGEPESDTLIVLAESAEFVGAETQMVKVPVTAGTGSLAWSPATLDFGTVTADIPVTASAELVNAGGIDAEVTLTLEGGSFSLEMDDDPLFLEAGDRAVIPVTFHADVAGTASGQLTASAAGAPDAILPLTGTVAGGLPVAVCSVDPAEVSSHDQTATWIGSASYDPGGSPIVEYAWSLVSAPAGSSAYLPSGGADRAGFVWDLSGEYVAELVVVNELGQRSEPCAATLVAAPTDRLWIELYWLNAGDDLDLHLLAPGGELNTDTDCYWVNCPEGYWLDWGLVGVAEDNPSLDIDDIAGTGPENIRLPDPADGLYTVVVHDFPSSVYSASNQFWVNVYVDGTLALESTCSVSGEDGYVTIATVEFPSGGVTDASCG